MDTHWGYVALVGVVFVLPFASLPFRPWLQTDISGCRAWRARLCPGRSNWWQEGRRSPFHPRYGIHRQGRPASFRSRPSDWLIGLFMLMAIFSFVYGMAHSRPTTTIIRRFGEILLGIGLFFIVINTVRSQRELNWVVRWLFLAAWGVRINRSAFLRHSRNMDCQSAPINWHGSTIPAASAPCAGSKMTPTAPCGQSVQRLTQMCWAV